MDLTISLPTHVSEEAKRMAEEMDISLDQLFALAISHYLSAFRGELVKEALDAVYEHEPSAIDPALLKLQAASVGREAW